MRPYTSEFDEPVGFEDFLYDRYEASSKPIRARRRDERIRHENRHRNFEKRRTLRDEWDWDDDDFESYVDDSYDEFYEE